VDYLNLQFYQNDHIKISSSTLLLSKFLGDHSSPTPFLLHPNLHIHNICANTIPNTSFPDSQIPRPPTTSPIKPYSRITAPRASAPDIEPPTQSLTGLLIFTGLPSFGRVVLGLYPVPNSFSPRMQSNSLADSFAADKFSRLVKKRKEHTLKRL
jgi:hypothetical protein